MNNLRKYFLNIYYLAMVPSGLMIAVYIIYSLVADKRIFFQIDDSMKWFIGYVILIASAFVSAGFPVLYRSWFAAKYRNAKKTPYYKFRAFQRNLIIAASYAPYMVFIALIFSIEGVHFYGTALFAIYAVYYHYPSQKKIKADVRIFRVTENEE